MGIQSGQKCPDAYLERLVVLEDLLHSSGDIVMLLADLFKIRSVTRRQIYRGELTIRGSNIRDLESKGSTAG